LFAVAKFTETDPETIDKVGIDSIISFTENSPVTSKSPVTDALPETDRLVPTEALPETAKVDAVVCSCGAGAPIKGTQVSVAES